MVTIERSENQNRKRSAPCPHCATRLSYTTADLQKFEEPKWGGIIMREVLGFQCPRCRGVCVLR